MWRCVVSTWALDGKVIELGRYNSPCGLPRLAESFSGVVMLRAELHENAEVDSGRERKEGTEECDEK